MLFPFAIPFAYFGQSTPPISTQMDHVLSNTCPLLEKKICRKWQKCLIL